MHTKSLLPIILCALAATSGAAPIITSLTRLDTDQTPGHTEQVVTFPTLAGPVGFEAAVYQDYSFTYNSWPSYLNGVEVVKMVNTDLIDADYQLQLTLSQPATVYLMIDDRTTTAALPWVSASGFTDTGDTVMVWEFPYSVYAAAAPAGPFTLRQNSPSPNMYTIAVAPEPSVSLLLAVAGAVSFTGRRHGRKRNG